jgi:Uma2 family endonuclease
MSDMATTIEETMHVPLYRICVDEYHRMGKAGVFGPDERVELLDGVLIAMPPIDPAHAFSVLALSKFLNEKLGGRALVNVQNPVVIGPTSEPQPDVMLLRPPLARYGKQLPVTADALLVVEVSDSTRAVDRGPKLRAYARSGVCEVWIVDLARNAVDVFTEPSGEDYARRIRAKRGDLVAPAAFPDAPIAVSDILPPLLGSAEPGG